MFAAKEQRKVSSLHLAFQCLLPFKAWMDVEAEGHSKPCQVFIQFTPALTIESSKATKYNATYYISICT